MSLLKFSDISREQNVKNVYYWLEKRVVSIYQIKLHVITKSIVNKLIKYMKICSVKVMQQFSIIQIIGISS